MTSGRLRIRSSEKGEYYEVILSDTEYLTIYTHLPWNMVLVEYYNEGNYISSQVLTKHQ